jgi:hypothetical protein
MAPSRAMATVVITPRILSSSRLLSSSSLLASRRLRLYHHHQHGANISTVHARSTSHTLLKAGRCTTPTAPRIVIRAYSTPAATAAADAETVEPPDFLDEQERSIFMTLKEELRPTALEVYFPVAGIWFPCSKPVDQVAFDLSRC